MELSSSLKVLQTLLPKPIYVVGGAVRDALIGYKHYDIDLAGEMSPKQLMDALNGTPFEVHPTSMRLGTVRITCPGEFYEYTTFRQDSYRGGEHSPSEVRFASSLEVDAVRRDFTVNAIYWSVKDILILDPLCGREDIRRKQIRTTIDPETVLSQDGLRIMRMVRQSAELGFSVEENTYAAAKKNVGLLKEISPERLRDELVKCLYADRRHGVEGAHDTAIRMLVDLGAMEYLFPELLEGVGVAQRPDYHKYTVIEHILHAVSYAPPSVRLAAMFHDIGKPGLMKTTGNAKGHAKTGIFIAREALKRLKFPKKEIERTERLVCYHMFDQKGDCTDAEVREFIQENYDLIDDLIALKKADQLAKGMGSDISQSAMRLQTVKDSMEDECVPMCVKGLKVSGDDLIALNIQEEKRAESLQSLLKKSACGGYRLREEQLEYLKRFSK